MIISNAADLILGLLADDDNAQTWKRVMKRDKGSLRLGRLCRSNNNIMA
jgi:hypothetical protein